MRHCLYWNTQRPSSLGTPISCMSVKQHGPEWGGEDDGFRVFVPRFLAAAVFYDRGPRALLLRRTRQQKGENDRCPPFPSALSPEICCRIHRKSPGLLTSGTPLSLPVRADLQSPVRLHRVVGPQTNLEEVRTPHSLVHGELRRDLGLLLRLQGLRADDRFGWSAPLHSFHGRIGV